MKDDNKAGLTNKIFASVSTRGKNQNKKNEYKAIIEMHMLQQRKTWYMQQLMIKKNTKHTTNKGKLNNILQMEERETVAQLPF